MPKVKTQQKLPKKFNPGVSSDEIATVSSESEIFNNLNSPKKVQREAALIFLVNYDINRLRTIITPEIRNLLLEMIIHEESEDMFTLSLGVLRNYIQELLNFSLTDDEIIDEQEQIKQFNEFNWNRLIDGLIQKKDTPYILEWMRLVRVLCCADIFTINSVTKESKEKFFQILNIVSSFLINQDILGTVYYGDGAHALWEALYIFFVWTDNNHEACIQVKQNDLLLNSLNNFISNKTPPQKAASRKYFGMKYTKLQKETEDFDMEEVDEEGNIVTPTSTVTLENNHENAQLDYPYYIKIITYSILYNIQLEIQSNDTNSLLSTILSTYQNLNNLITETNPTAHIEELISLFSSVHLSHQEADKIRDDWRLPIEGQKLGMEIFANIISNLAYDIKSPKYNIEDDGESSILKNYYDFVSQSDIILKFSNFVSTFTNLQNSNIKLKLDFVTDQVNILGETLISTLGCLINIFISSHSNLLVKYLPLLQSLSNGLFSLMQETTLLSNEIFDEFLESVTLLQWTLLRKLDDIDVSFNSTNIALKLLSHQSYIIRRNSIGIISEFGARDHSQEENRQILDALLLKLSDKHVLVSVESLKAIFNVFSDDTFDSNVKSQQLIKKLQVFKDQVFLQKFQNQINLLDDEDKEIVQEAMANLSAFIQYKRNSLR